MSEALAAPSETRWRIAAGALAACLAAGVWAAVVREPIAAALAVTAAVAVWLGLRAPHALFALWFAATPWASYLLRFPEERSIVTFDRVMVVAVVAGFVARAWPRPERRRVTLFEVAWLCFCLTAVASALALSYEKPFAMRTAVDAFLLPLALFFALRIGFEPARGGRAVLWAAVALGLTLPLPGLVEFSSATDLMAWAGASIFRTGIVRANGPFATDNSYAIVGALLAIFLAFLPRALGLRLAGHARWLWTAALAGAAMTAAIPAFRAVLAALAVALAVPAMLEGRIRTVARAAAVGLLALLASAPLILAVSQTATFRDRIVDPSSAFSRAATYFAALDVAADAPIFGVGLANYHEYFLRKYGDAWYVEVEAVNEIGAESYPHNNALGVLAELGVVGLFFYLAAAVALAGYAWRRRAYAALALMVAYHLCGLTLQSGVYADLNLYYFAMLAIMLNPSTER